MKESYNLDMDYIAIKKRYGLYYHHYLVVSFIILYNFFCFFCTIDSYFI